MKMDMALRSSLDAKNDAASEGGARSSETRIQVTSAAARSFQGETKVDAPAPGRPDYVKSAMRDLNPEQLSFQGKLVLGSAAYLGVHYLVWGGLTPTPAWVLGAAVLAVTTLKSIGDLLPLAGAAVKSVALTLMDKSVEAVKKIFKPISNLFRPGDF